MTLSAEYEHMKNYLTIQKIRFEDRVHIEVEDLPAQGELVTVPRLILQPIVENSYKYVFEHVEKEGRLRVKTKETEEAISIIVEDSGFEMSDTVIMRIQEAFTKDDGHITGLGNLNKRLQFINPQNKIDVKKSELGGSEIVLTIIKEGDGEHV